MDFLQDDTCRLREYLEASIHVKNIHESYKTLYEHCRKSMIGGPSIVFHRYHEVGETKIRCRPIGISGKTLWVGAGI